MSKPKITVTLTGVLDNQLWGCEEMLESGCLTIKNIKELIQEDWGTFIDEAELNVCIEMIEEQVCKEVESKEGGENE